MSRAVRNLPAMPRPKTRTRRHTPLHGLGLGPDRDVEGGAVAVRGRARVRDEHVAEAERRREHVGVVGPRLDRQALPQLVELVEGHEAPELLASVSAHAL